MTTSLNISALLDSQGVSYSSGTESKNGSPGWLQMRCPYCGDHSDHLGFNLRREYFNCWRCGWHPLTKTVADLAGLSWYEAQRIIEEHYERDARREGEVPAPRPAMIALPSGMLQPIHLKYLHKRKFTQEQLAPYNLKGVGPFGDYRFRIIAPIYFHGKLVSYQTRDVTSKGSPPYLACPKDQEVRDHKKCLYAMDLARDSDTVVVVEGIADAWRLGPGAVATFGTEYTWAQLQLLKDNWHRHFILFDPEPNARRRAEMLAANLAVFGHDVHVLDLEEHGDPAEMPQDEADELMVSCHIKNV